MISENLLKIEVAGFCPATNEYRHRTNIADSILLKNTGLVRNSPSLYILLTEKVDARHQCNVAGIHALIYSLTHMHS